MKTTNTLYKGEVSISLIKQINYPLLKSFLSDVSCLYPEFESWLHFKVRRFDRDIVIAHDGNQLAGVSILKNFGSEKDLHILCGTSIPR